MTNETVRIYDEKAADYAAMTDDYNTEDPHLSAFIDAVPKGGHVLDLGCGPGMAAARMVATGLSVDAVDASSSMVNLANGRQGVTARQASFDQIEGAAIYDGVWANFSLLHAPRGDFPRHLAALHRALRPRGAFFIGMKLGTGEGPDRLGRFYTYYSEDELTELLADAGFTITGRRHGNAPGLDGTPSDWIALASHA